MKKTLILLLSLTIIACNPENNSTSTQNSSDNTSSNPFGFNANTTSNTSTNNDEVPFEEAKN